MNRDPLFWSQWVLAILVGIYAAVIIDYIHSPNGIAASTAPAMPTAGTNLSADDLRARAAFFSDVESAIRQDEAFRRGFVVTAVLQPVLDSLLKTLAVVVAIRVAPAALAAIVSGKWSLHEA